MSVVKVALVNFGDDWHALYINGKLVRSDHSIDADQLLEILNDHGVPLDIIDTPTWEDDECPWSQPDDDPHFYGSPPDTFADLMSWTYWDAERVSARERRKQWDPNYKEDNDE
jgi:hypothetical protein